MTTSDINMAKIVLHEEKNLQGRTHETSNDLSDISSYLSRVQSVRVESGCFMIYERPNFMGNQQLLRRGESIENLSLVGMSSGIKSIRLIPVHRGQFRIKVFEKENLTGQMNELMDDVENIQERLRMSEILSCQVMEGNWLLFEQPHHRGRVIFVKPGEQRTFREMGMGSIRIMSLRRITDIC